MRHRSAFSLIELMVTITIIAILSVFAIGSYRDYIVRSSIAALIPLADKVKIEVEDAHNQGTVFGSSGTQTYVATSDPDKPQGLDYIQRVAYGCINMSIDLADLHLTPTDVLIVAWCPTISENSVEWNCGYDSTTTTGLTTYLPSNCQTVSTSIRDTSF